MSNEIAELELEDFRRVFIETKEFGEISISESDRGVLINFGSEEVLILPKSHNMLVFQNPNKNEKD